MRIVALAKFLILLLLLVAAALALLAYARRHPEDMPWTKLDLAQPIGAFTGRKLATLTGDAPLCRHLLDRAGVRYTRLAAMSEGARCGYRDGIAFARGGSRTIALEPRRVGFSCPVGAALAVWEWEVLQPAALRHFDSPVAAIEHYGSYNCRRMYGRGTGSWSEHSTADAIDIAGFRLRDGRRILVRRDWNGDADEAAFLREARDGACRLFASVLSPDYNAAHADHLHLDQAERGATGWRACR